MAAGSSPIFTFSKDPVAILDYSINWEDWLQGDRILTSSWSVPSGITSAGDAFSSTTSTVLIAGGTAGTSYSIYNTITTIAGRTEKRTIKINAVDR